MKMILVAIDFSPGTAEVTGCVIRLARAFGGAVKLVHVAPPDPDFVGYSPGPQAVRDLLAQRFREEHRELQELERRFRDENVTASALLIQGEPIEKLLKEATESRADLIVMGSHGHGRLHHLLVGSVTEGVLRKAPCPVLIVPLQRNV